MKQSCVIKITQSKDISVLNEVLNNVHNICINVNNLCSATIFGRFCLLSIRTERCQLIVALMFHHARHIK